MNRRDDERPETASGNRPEDERHLAELGEALCDERPVDWERELSGRPELEPTLRRLQQIESLRRAHRAIAERYPARTAAAPGLFDWGPLRVLEKVGEGGFGEVYRALDTRLQREVALKLRRTGSGGETEEAGARRFLEEARRLARVRHSNVLVIHGADRHDGRPGFWTDFIRGRTLAALLARNGPLDPAEAARIGFALCRALGAVHAAGFVHGDVKASNVMREDGGRILLMDFGAATRRPDPEEIGPEPPAFGTPLVLAPEVVRGEPAQPRSDLYSLGLLLYQLVAGELPFADGTWAELVRRHEQAPRISLGARRPDLPVAFRSVVERALEPEPSARFGSAAEMERALHAAIPSAADPEDAGQSLRALLQELGRVPEEFCRQLAREATGVLARIHAVGGTMGRIDLDHIRLRPDGTVELLRVPDAPSATEAPTAAVPDAADASPVDDLRALGVALLELTRGLNPASRRESSPSFLEAVLSSLAGDAPGPRIGAAAELLQVLADGETGSWWQERQREDRRGSRPAVQRPRVARETSLFGRERDLAVLRTAFAEARTGAGRVILLEGEAGIGKTRLVDALIEELLREDAGMQFLCGTFPPAGGATATDAFVNAFRDHFAPGRLEETLASHLRSTPRLVASLTALFRGEGPVPGDAALTRETLPGAFARLMHSLAEELPTILLIDDLHFAPLDGRGLFAALANAVAGRRVLLIGATRPGLPEGWTSALERLEHCRRLALARLTPVEVARVLAEALDSDPLADELAPELARRTGGNPLFLFEHLRALKEARVVAATEDGRWTATAPLRRIGAPATIEHLIRARLAGLSEEDQELLDVASCCGFEFDPSLVGEALGTGALPALRRFARIERRHQLIRSCGRLCAFDHHQVQESLYGWLLPQLREQYHAALAVALEAREQARAQEPAALDGGLAVALCEHYLRGGRGAEGLRYLRRALDHLSTLRPAATVELIDRVLAVPGLVGGGERIALLGRKVRQLPALGRPGEEEAALREMLELADAAGEPAARAHARHGLAFFLNRRGQVDPARALLEEAQTLAHASGDVFEEARVAQTRGSMALHAARHEEALGLYARAAELARRAGNPLLEAQVLGSIGVACLGLRRLDEALRACEQHLAGARAAGSRSSEAIALGNIAAVLLEAERYDEALPRLEQHLQVARENGLRLGEAYATGNLGLLHLLLGRTGEALDWLEQSLRIAREIGYRLPEAEALQRLGTVFGLLGRDDEAWRSHEQALAVGRQIRNAHAEGHALLGLGSVAERRSDLAAARKLYEQAEAVFATTDTAADLGEAALRLGVLFCRLNRIEEARTKLREALDRGREVRAAKLEAPASAYLATLPGGDPAAARRRFAELEARLPRAVRMEAAVVLGRALDDPELLAAAHRELLFLQAHAPPENRETMRTGVALYREITAASPGVREEYGSEPGSTLPNLEKKRPL